MRQPRASSNVVPGPLWVRISALGLTCFTAVAGVAAAESVESAPYYLAGGVPALTLAAGIALLCRIELRDGGEHHAAHHNE